MAWTIRIVLAAFLMVAAASGATFTASVNGCVPETNIGTGPQTALTAQIQCGPGWVYVNAYAQASEFGLQASADGYQYCCGSSGGSTGLASVVTEFIITGPQGSGPVLISLNLDLTAGVGGGTTNGYSGRFVRLDVSMGYVGNLFTEYGEISDGLNGLSYWFNSNIPSHAGYMPGACLPCLVKTGEAMVPVNTRIHFSMTLQAWIGQFGDAYGYANAAHTLYFPKNGPVFNLPEGYSAEIFGMNVVGNRVVGLDDPGDGGGGGEVPEPASAALMALGLAGVAVMRRRRR